jgi:hypothetical protein
VVSGTAAAATQPAKPGGRTAAGSASRAPNCRNGHAPGLQPTRMTSSVLGWEASHVLVARSGAGGRRQRPTGMQWEDGADGPSSLDG